MKPLEELTYLGQVRRLRRLAESALDAYGLEGAKLTLLHHGENTTFRVDTPDTGITKRADRRFVGNRYLLRIHRRGYQTASTIASELAWLAALRQDACLPVPEPLRSRDGELLIQVSAPGVPERLNCSLLCWQNGRKVGDRLRPRHFAALGRLMAQLQDHATGWRKPPGFVRRHWDWEGLFGDNAGFNLPGREVWALLPPPYEEPFQEVASEMRRVMQSLGKGPEVFDLIHADLVLGSDGNVLFLGEEARAIDFDDCGFGYWVYDFAVPLAHWQLSEDWPRFRSALLDGYAQVRPLAEDQLAFLDVFMAARHVSEILWAIDIAQVNPAFRVGLDAWIAWAGRHIQYYLDGRK